MATDTTKMPVSRTFARVSRSAALAAVVLAMAACSLRPGGRPEPVTPPTPSPQPPSQPAPELPTTATLPPAAAPGTTRPAPLGSPGYRGAHADRVIQLAGSCSQTETDGFGERAVVDVRGNTVHSLNWEIKIGRHGVCHFAGADFRQVKSRPHIELHARDGSGCKLMIWQEPRRVTLAHANCARYCSPPTIYDKAWPVMFDPATGNCARTG
ncbi:MAG: hypothetical protein H6934_12600 [Burkholderiaceae bacterium]|nr:hypothetical protein [Burkholderiaceae bacterium]